TLAAYSRLDAELTLILDEAEQAFAMDQGHRTSISSDLRLAALLYRMERKGVGLDAPGMRAEAAKLSELIREAGLKVPFRGSTGMPTPPAAVKYFFGPPPDGLELVPFDDKMTKGGATKGPQPQVDEEVIARLVKQGIPGAAEYAKFAELKAAYEKWYLPSPASAAATAGSAPPTSRALWSAAGSPSSAGRPRQCPSTTRFLKGSGLRATSLPPSPAMRRGRWTPARPRSALPPAWLRKRTCTGC